MPELIDRADSDRLIAVHRAGDSAAAKIIHPAGVHKVPSVDDRACVVDDAAAPAGWVEKPGVGEGPVVDELGEVAEDEIGIGVIVHGARVGEYGAGPVGDQSGDVVDLAARTIGQRVAFIL